MAEEDTLNDLSNDQVTQIEPVIVQYCPICTLPPEYCCYNSLYMTDCRDWIINNYEFNELVNLNITKEELLEQWDQIFEKEGKKIKVVNDSSKKDDEATRVKIIVSNRGARRFITEIHGLGHYTDIKIACKDIKKKFACAATVVDTNMKGRKSERNNKKQEKYRLREMERQNRKNKKNGIPIQIIDTPSNNDKHKTVMSCDQIIEAQGDISDNLVDFINNKFKVPIENIKRKKK